MAGPAQAELQPPPGMLRAQTPARTCPEPRYQHRARPELAPDTPSSEMLLQAPDGGGTKRLPGAKT